MLDRQHPRDIFDTMLLFQNEGFDEQTRKAFLVYLISHPRPIYELLNPRTKEISAEYENEFSGMNFDNVAIETLLSFRNDSISSINRSINNDEKAFLLSIKAGDPKWHLLGLDHIKDLPAVKWKIHNIRQMDKGKKALRLKLLDDFLANI